MTLIFALVSKFEFSVGPGNNQRESDLHRLREGGVVREGVWEGGSVGEGGWE